MMYLHIGKDYLLNTNEIIGIFDINSLKETKCYEGLIENVNIVEDLSDNNCKTLILTVEDSTKKEYISNILSTTIANRSNW